MGKNIGSYGLAGVSYKSTYLRRGAVRALHDGTNPDLQSVRVAYAPGVVVTLPGAGEPVGAPLGLSRERISTDPTALLEEARDVLEQMLPARQDPPGRLVGPEEQAVINGKGSLAVSPSAKKWLGAWERGTRYSLRYGLDSSGKPYLMLQPPAPAKEPKPPEEIRTPLRVVKITKPCPCGEGELENTGLTLTSSPPLHAHRCASCGREERLRKKYPSYEYEVDTRA